AARSAARDPRPYLEYLRNDTALIEIRGLQVSVAEAPVFPIGDLYIPLIDELSRRRALDQSLAAHPRLVILGDPGAGKTTFLRRMANTASHERMAKASSPFPILIRVSELAGFL